MAFEFRVKYHEEERSLLGDVQETKINSAVKKGFSNDGTDLGTLVDVVVNENLDLIHYVFQKDGERSYMVPAEKLERINTLRNKLKNTVKCRAIQIIPTMELFGKQMRLLFADVAQYGDIIQVCEKDFEKNGLTTLAGTYQVQGKPYTLTTVCCGKKGIDEMLFVPVNGNLYFNTVKVKGIDACKKTLAQKIKTD